MNKHLPIEKLFIIMNDILFLRTKIKTGTFIQLYTVYWIAWKSYGNARSAHTIASSIWLPSLTSGHFPPKENRHHEYHETPRGDGGSEWRRWDWRRQPVHVAIKWRKTSFQLCRQRRRHQTRRYDVIGWDGGTDWTDWLIIIDDRRLFDWAHLSAVRR